MVMCATSLRFVKMPRKFFVDRPFFYAVVNANQNLLFAVPLTTSVTRVHRIPYTTSHQLYRVSHRVITRKRFSLDVGVIGTHTLYLIGL